jgi:hypothetical protein
VRKRIASFSVKLPCVLLDDPLGLDNKLAFFVFLRGIICFEVCPAKVAVLNDE